MSCDLPSSTLFIWVVNGRLRAIRNTTTKGIEHLAAHNNDIMDKNLFELEKSSLYNMIQGPAIYINI